MSSDDASNLPPTTSLIAGKYQLLHLIGRGGMGSVWEGRHASLGTRVAIKFIETEYVNSQDARNRFDNEARAAATIQSKHAIQIYDHGMTEDGRPYIVMELLEGEPLDRRLKNETRLSMQDTARVIQQVCRALGRAHERGIIHRDLKPENIFLVRNSDDDDEIAKVLDFGIAKMRSTPGAVGVSSSTKTGTLLGTPFFMSPEQARGLRNVDHRSDLWSLGVIVFKCVTGVLPFDGESLGDLLVKICTVQVPVPSHAMPGLPPELDAWMMRALDREPASRFQTATELSEALSLACGLSFKRSPTSRTPEPGGFVPSSGSPYSGGSGSVRPPARSGGAYATPEYGAGAIPAATSAPFTASAPRSTSSSKVGPILGAVVLGLALGIGGIFMFVSRSRHDSANGLATSTGTGGPATSAGGGVAPGASPPETASAASSAQPPAVVNSEPLPPASASAGKPVSPTAPVKPIRPGSGQANAGKATKPSTTPATPTPVVTAPKSNPSGSDPGY